MIWIYEKKEVELILSKEPNYLCKKKKLDDTWSNLLVCEELIWICEKKEETELYRAIN